VTLSLFDGLKGGRWLGEAVSFEARALGWGSAFLSGHRGNGLPAVY